MYEVDGPAFVDSPSGSSSSVLSAESFRRLDWREERKIRWLFLREPEMEMASGTTARARGREGGRGGREAHYYHKIMKRDLAALRAAAPYG